MSCNILFPSSYFDNRKVDESFQEEYDAALEEGFLPVLFNQRIWDEDKKILLDYPVLNQRQTIYRGWMIKPEDYSLFYKKLQEKGINLLVPPMSYINCHCFPYVWLMVKEDSPKLKAYPNAFYPNIKENGLPIGSLLQDFDRFMIKDFVKSGKDTDIPLYFDKNTTQREFDYWLYQFIEMRGDLYTMGIVAKEYVDLKQYLGNTNEFRVFYNEFRVFYLNGEILSINRNSSQSVLVTPEVPWNLIQKYANLPSPFYTVDFAEKDDGSWIVIDTGDGGVSGLSEGQNCGAFYRGIKSLLDKNKEEQLEF